MPCKGLQQFIISVLCLLLHVPRFRRACLKCCSSSLVKLSADPFSGAPWPRTIICFGNSAAQHQQFFHCSSSSSSSSSSGGGGGGGSSSSSSSRNNNSSGISSTAAAGIPVLKKSWTPAICPTWQPASPKINLAYGHLSNRLPGSAGQDCKWH